MTSSTGRGFFAYQFPARTLASAALATIIGLAAPAAGHAQESEAPAWSLKRLFTSRKVEPPVEAAPEPEAAEPAAARKKARVTREPIDPQSTVVVKRPDAAVVMVVGDFMGSGLAEGLVTAYVDNPHVKVIDRTNGSSGFVRDDFYDWPARIGELIDAEKPDAVVIMLGANDRQQMNIDGSREAVRSEAWVRAYTARTQALAKAVADRKVPFVWVGVPSFKSSKMLLDMLAFNEIYKAAATGAGAEFVDIWDGFVDEDGGYVANGPDLNGQPARLRAADGINLARPGKRKLAFYAEKPLGKLLGDAVTAPAPADPIADRRHETTPFGPMIAPLAEEAEVVIGASDLGPIDPGRPISLRSPALDGGAELLGLVAEPRHDARTPGEKLTIEGIAAAAPAGRADDFSWNPQGQTEFAAAIAPARPTTGKTPPPVLLSALAGPDTPAAPPATLETPEQTVPPLPMVPGELTEATEPKAGERPPVTELAPDAVPQDDLAAVGKGPVTLEPGANATDRSPNRASPAAAPEIAPSSGPAAEGAPTILPEPEIEVAPVIIETPIAALPAPSVVAALPTTLPTGARTGVPNAPQKLARDAAPRAAPAPQAIKPPTSARTVAQAAPAAPAALPQDRAEPKLQVGMAPEMARETGARPGAPTDGDTSAEIAAPGRAAPAMADELPADTRPTGEGKLPSALMAEAGDAAPQQLAPSELVAIVAPDPSERLWAWPIEPDAVPALVATPAALPAPTALRTGGETTTPALALPPETPRPKPIAVPATDFSALVSVPPDLVPAAPVMATEPTEPEALAALQQETPEIKPAAPMAAPKEEPGAQPETAEEPHATPAPEPELAPAASTGLEAASAPEHAVVAPVAAAAPPPATDRVEVPATDFSALVSVPPDLVSAMPAVPVEVSEPATAPAKPDAIASLQPEAPEPEQPAAQAAAAPDAAAPSAPETASPVEAPADASPPLAEQVPAPAQAVDAFTAPETDIAALTSVPPDLMPALPETAPTKPMIEAGPAATPAPVTAPVASQEPGAAVKASQADSKPAGEEIAALQQQAPETVENPPAAPTDVSAASGDAKPAVTEAAPADPQPATAPILVPETDFAALLSVPPDLVPTMPAAEPATPPAEPAEAKVAPAVSPETKAEPASVPEPAVTPTVAPDEKIQPEPVAQAPVAAQPEPAETAPAPEAATAVSTQTRAQAEASPADDEAGGEKIAALQQEAPESIAAPDATTAESAPAAPEDRAAPVAAPLGAERVILPEIDISALSSVPPDLLAAPQPAAAAPASKPGFPVFDSVDEIPAPRLDAAGAMPAAR